MFKHPITGESLTRSQFIELARSLREDSGAEEYESGHSQTRTFDSEGRASYSHTPHYQYDHVPGANNAFTTLGLEERHNLTDRLARRASELAQSTPRTETLKPGKVFAPMAGAAVGAGVGAALANRVNPGLAMAGAAAGAIGSGVLTSKIWNSANKERYARNDREHLREVTPEIASVAKRLQEMHKQASEDPRNRGYLVAGATAPAGAVLGSKAGASLAKHIAAHAKRLPPNLQFARGVGHAVGGAAGFVGGAILGGKLGTDSATPEQYKYASSDNVEAAKNMATDIAFAAPASAAGVAAGMGLKYGVEHKGFKGMGSKIYGAAKSKLSGLRGPSKGGLTGKALVASLPFIGYEAGGHIGSFYGRRHHIESMNKQAAEKEKSQHNGLKAIGAGMAGITGGTGLAMHMKDNFPNHKLRQSHASKEAVRSYINSNHLKGRVTIGRRAQDLGAYSSIDAMGPSVADTHIRGANPGFGAKPGLKDYTVNMAGVKDRDLLMHELGHAKLRSRLGENKSKVLNYARAIGTQAALPGALVGYHVAKNSDTKTGAAVGAGIAVAPHVATLADEAYASGSAVKHIAKKQGFKPAAKASWKLGKAFGSYAGLASVGAAAAHYGLKARQERLDKKKAGK